MVTCAGAAPGLRGGRRAGTGRWRPPRSATSSRAAARRCRAWRRRRRRPQRIERSAATGWSASTRSESAPGPSTSSIVTVCAAAATGPADARPRAGFGPDRDGDAGAVGRARVDQRERRLEVAGPALGERADQCRAGAGRRRTPARWSGRRRRDRRWHRRHRGDQARRTPPTCPASCRRPCRWPARPGPHRRLCRKGIDDPPRVDSRTRATSTSRSEERNFFMTNAEAVHVF